MRPLQRWMVANLLFANLVVAAESPRPRGVGPEFARFYKSTEFFTCIANPGIQLELSQVNDDYCDCPDGSDEPGTSACSYLSRLSPPSPYSAVTDGSNVTLSLPGFYCKNRGHRPSYVPFTQINDGVCDHDLCCDGSDEWAGVGGVKCEDKCKEIGIEWRKQDQERKKAMGAAIKKRKELVSESARLRKEVEDRIETLGTELGASELKLAALERELVEVERRERGKVVKSSGKTKKVNVLAGLAKQRIEELREALMATRRQRDARYATVQQLEGILSTFKEEYNPNFNDEGVKRAVRSWEEYAAKRGDAAEEEAEIKDEDLDEISKADGPEGGIKWEEWEGEDESDVDVLYRLEAYLPPSLRDWVDEKLRDLRVLLISNGIIADSSSETESKPVADARAAVQAAEEEVRRTGEQLQSHRDDLQRDYGADAVFRALKDRCVERDSGEYTYELCWMSSTTQKPKKGGAHTSLGNFVSFTTEVVGDSAGEGDVDGSIEGEDVPADGRGLGSGERVALRYEGGQVCWNGPARSTLVVLGCAERDEIWKVVETEKCVYRFEAGSPAVCVADATSGRGAGGKGGNGGKGSSKDEL